MIKAESVYIILGSTTKINQESQKPVIFHEPQDFELKNGTTAVINNGYPRIDTKTAYHSDTISHNAESSTVRSSPIIRDREVIKKMTNNRKLTDYYDITMKRNNNKNRLE